MRHVRTWLAKQVPRSLAPVLFRATLELLIAPLAPIVKRITTVPCSDGSRVTARSKQLCARRA